MTAGSYAVRLLSSEAARAWNDLADGTLDHETVRRIETVLAESGAEDFVAFGVEAQGDLCGLATARVTVHPWVAAAVRSKRSCVVRQREKTFTKRSKSSTFGWRLAPLLREVAAPLATGVAGKHELGRARSARPGRAVSGCTATGRAGAETNPVTAVQPGRGTADQS
jgi:hypothetical protein